VLERETAAAFRRTARRVVRRRDALVHEWGSDSFLIAMLDRGREGGVPSAADCRLTLERLVAGVFERSARRESGWWTIERVRSRRDLDRAISLALERGRRERERYEFLAAVGHELRTPLASIRGYLESVIDGEVDAARAQEFLEIARRETLRLGSMIDGMLEFSLLDLSPPALSTPCCDVGERARSVMETLLPRARARGMALRCDGATTALARIDGDACLHALLNLVDNAIRYGRERGEVRLCCRCAAEIEVTVDDDGFGYDGRIRGHGLGLTIARTIAEHAGGALELSSSPMGGTRATLRLPRESARAEGRCASS
jgi:signal transduction histidine kinase